MAGEPNAAAIDATEGAGGAAGGGGRVVDLPVRGGGARRGPRGAAADIVRDLAMEADVARGLLANMADLMADDPELAHTTIEGETDLHAALDRGARRLAELEAMGDAIEIMAARLASRRKRLEMQERAIKEAILAAMEIAGIRRLELAHATLATKVRPQSLDVEDEARIPSQWFRPGEPKLDKKGLLAALKGGEAVAGVRLSESVLTLQINRS